MKILIVSLFCLVGSQSFAASAPRDMTQEPSFKANVEELAKAWDFSMQLRSLKSNRGAEALLTHANFDDNERNCEDGRPGGAPRGACVEAVCKRLGAFGCDDQSEIQKVAEMCRGNRNGACVEKACSYLGTFGCDDVSEISQVAQSCRGVQGGDCVDTLCKKLGAFGCDDIGEMKTVLESCR